MRIVVCLFPLSVLSSVETDHKPTVIKAPKPSSELWHDISHEMFPMGIFGESTSQVSPVSYTLEEVELGRVVGSSPTSVVYEIAGFDDKWVVKYQTYCWADDGMDDDFGDSVERETFFMKEIYALDSSLTIRHLLTSSMMRVPPGGGKLGDRKLDCGVYTARVKYMISERLDRSVNDIVNQVGKIPIEAAARLTLQMVGLIERLHRFNIVHGDVHPGNFMIRRNTSPQSMVLIDFGRSKYAPTQEQANANNPAARDLHCHPFFSPWEMRHEIVSFRDDIFRVIQTMAMMIHGVRFYHVMHAITSAEEPTEEDRDHYREIKGTANLFDVVMRVPKDDILREEVSFTLIDSVGVTAKNYLPIRALLSDLLAEVRSPKTPMDKPNYELIKKHLREIIKLVHSS